MNNLETERLVLRNWQDGDAEEPDISVLNKDFLIEAYKRAEKIAEMVE